MGNTIWIEVRGRPANETHEDMNVLHALEKHLDVLAEKLGVTSLTDFYDYGEPLANFGDAEDELPDPSWFDSAKGLESFGTLRACLEKNFASLDWRPVGSEQHYPQTLFEQLQFCQSVLEEAVRKGQQFRLLIVS
jgi:hypothetical protein